MRRVVLWSLTLILVGVVAASAAPPELKTDEQKAFSASASP